MCIVKTSAGGYSVAIPDCKGTVHFLTIPQFDARFHDEEQFRRVFSSVEKYSFDLAHSVGNVRFIARVINSFIFVSSLF